MKTIFKISAAIVLLLILFFFAKEYINRGISLEQTSKDLQLSRDSTKKFVDLYGTTHNILEVTNINTRTALIVRDSTIKDLCKRLDLKPKQITEFVPFEVSKKGVIEFTVAELDSIIMSYKNRGKDTSDFLSDILKDTTKVYLPYTSSINVNYLKYWDRNRFLFWKHGTALQAKSWYIDIFSLDDSVRTDIYPSIHVADEYSSFSVSLTAGFTVPNMRPAAVVGLSYTPKFLRFKKRR